MAYFELSDGVYTLRKTDGNGKVMAKVYVRDDGSMRREHWDLAESVVNVPGGDQSDNYYTQFVAPTNGNPVAWHLTRDGSWTYGDGAPVKGYNLPHAGGVVWTRWTHHTAKMA